jgi:hypothetical protein
VCGVRREKYVLTTVARRHLEGSMFRVECDDVREGAVGCVLQRGEIVCEGFFEFGCWLGLVRVWEK